MTGGTDLNAGLEIGWQGKPRAAAALRAVIVAVPLLAGLGAATVAGHVVPRPRHLGLVVLWFGLAFATSTLTTFIVAKGARRLLPLATLLKFSMAFPDTAPSRFKLALRAGSTTNLKKRVEEIREKGIENETGTAAETILVLAAALNAHDRATRGHSERVRALSELIGEEMGLSDVDRDRLRWSALLHDCGKIMVDPHVLNKSERLGEDDWQAIQQHPEEGARLAAPLASWLGEWSHAIVEHHERWDGTGYPHRLAGEQISLGARIVAVADAFETMTSVRSYKTAMTPTAAREELARCAGQQFDPRVVRAFLNVSLGRLRWIMGPITWLAEFPMLRSVPAGAQTGSSAATSMAAAGGAIAVAAGSALGVMPAAVSQAQAAPPAVVASAPTTAVPTAPPTTFVIAPTPTTVRGTVAAVTVVTTSTAPPPVAPAPSTTSTTRRPNQPVVAYDDQAQTQRSNSKPVKIFVTANDVDPDGDVSAAPVTIVTAPLHGKANPGDGAVNYIPDNTEYAGADSFVYRVCDAGGACATATVRLVITDV